MFEESLSSIPSLWASMNSWFTPTVLFVLLNLMIGTIAITSSLTSQNHHRHQDSGAERPQHHQLARSPSVLQRLKSNFYSYRSQEPTSNFLKPPEINEISTDALAPTTPDQRELSYVSRSPSVLQKLKSINLYNFISPAEKTPPPEPPQEEAAAAEEEEEEEEEEDERNEDDGDQFDDNDDDHQAQTLDEIYSQLKSGVVRSMSDTKPTAGEPAPKKLSRKMKKSASAKSAFAHFEEAEVVEARRPVTVREGKVKAAEVEDEEVDAKADDFINKFKHQLKLQRLDSIIRYKEMIGRGSGK